MAGRVAFASVERSLTEVRVEGWWTVSYVVLWGLVITLCIVVVALARQIGTLHLRLGPRGALEMDDEGPPLREAPPAFDVTDTAGLPVTIGGPGRAQCLVFVSPGCRLCEEILPSVHVVAQAASMDPVVLADADAHEAASTYGSRKLRAPVIPAHEVAVAYSVPGTPYAVILDELGIVRAKGAINNLEQMEGLVDTARKRVAEAQSERQAS
jgi:methylamine dehydrogenase accessory protein MauD